MKNKRLIFVHTPKCGGSFVRLILKRFNITSTGQHQRARGKDQKTYITFTDIRNPVDRFESFMNYSFFELA